MERAFSLNGRKVTEDDLTQVVRSLADPVRLRSTGGALFKADIADDAARIGVVPVIADATRMYHFNIDLGPTPGPLLIGGFQADGSLQVLCPPPEGRHWDDETLPPVRAGIRRFCELLAGHGYPADAPFDWITLKWFEDDRVFGSEVKTVGDLGSRQPESP